MDHSDLILLGGGRRPSRIHNVWRWREGVPNQSHWKWCVATEPSCPAGWATDWLQSALWRVSWPYFYAFSHANNHHNVCLWLLVLSWWPRSARYEHWFSFRHTRHLIDSDSDRFYFVDLRLRLWWDRTCAHPWLRLSEQFYRSNNWPALNKAWVVAQLDW